MTTLAVITLVLAGLRLGVAVLLLIVGFHLLQFDRPQARAETGGLMTPVYAVGLDLPVLMAQAFAKIIILLFVLVVVMIFLLISLLLFFAGTGLLARRRSGRWLSLVLGAFAGILAALYLLQLVTAPFDQEPPTGAAIAVCLLGVLIHGGYCGLVFMVLLKKRNAAEFV